MTKIVSVSWYHTEEFKRDFEVEDDFDLSEDLDEEDNPLLDQILNLEQAELSEAFTGCTAREITEVTPTTEEGA